MCFLISCTLICVSFVYSYTVRWPSTWSSTSPRGLSRSLPVVLSPTTTSISTGCPKPNPESPMGPTLRLLTAPAEPRAGSWGGKTTCTLLPPLALFAAPALAHCLPPWSTSISRPDHGLWTPIPPDNVFPLHLPVLAVVLKMFLWMYMLHFVGVQQKFLFREPKIHKNFCGVLLP